MDSEFNGRDASVKSRDFSNPMYDAVGGAIDPSSSSSKGGISPFEFRGTHGHLILFYLFLSPRASVILSYPLR